MQPGEEEEEVEEEDGDDDNEEAQVDKDLDRYESDFIDDKDVE